MYRISERMCLVTVRIKLTAYNKRLVNPYVSIQIEKKIEILHDLKFKKKNRQTTIKWQFYLYSLKFLKTRFYTIHREEVTNTFYRVALKKKW